MGDRLDGGLAKTTCPRAARLASARVGGIATERTLRSGGVGGDHFSSGRRRFIAGTTGGAPRRGHVKTLHPWITRTSSLSSEWIFPSP